MIKKIVLFIGRFQPLHDGHLNMMKRIVEHVKKYTTDEVYQDTMFVLGIGHAMSPDIRHPFSPDEVASQVTPEICQIDNSHYWNIMRLPDINSPDEYQAYVEMQLCANFLGIAANLLNGSIRCSIYSNEDSVKECFTKPIRDNVYWERVSLGRPKDGISGTKIREILFPDEPVVRDLENLLPDPEWVKAVEALPTRVWKLCWWHTALYSDVTATLMIGNKQGLLKCPYGRFRHQLWTRGARGFHSIITIKPKPVKKTDKQVTESINPNPVKKETQMKSPTTKERIEQYNEDHARTSSCVRNPFPQADQVYPDQTLDENVLVMLAGALAQRNRGTTSRLIAEMITDKSLRLIVHDSDMQMHLSTQHPHLSNRIYTLQKFAALAQCNIQDYTWLFDNVVLMMLAQHALHQAIKLESPPKIPGVVTDLQRMQSVVNTLSKQVEDMIEDTMKGENHE